MSDDAKARIDKMESDINEMFSVYGGLYEGVREVVVDIVGKVKERTNEALEERDRELLDIARRLTDLISAVADKIEKTTLD
jgi:phenylpyruvate tautomerase PptA (4-oxalocrotonate tautomerase family)